MTTPASVALVTGSTSGIGEGIARRLASDGHHVVVHSLSSVDAGRALAGASDVLVNNAGISWPIEHADLGAASPADWRRLLEVTPACAPGLVDPVCASKAALNHTTRLLAADVVAAVVASTYLTGEVIVLDGGMNLV